MDVALSRGACRMMEFFRLTDLVSTMWPHQPWIQKSLINVSHKKQLLSRSMLFYLRACGWQIFAVYQSMNMCDGVSLYGMGVVGGGGEKCLWIQTLQRMWAASVCLCCPCQSIKSDPYISLSLKAFNELHIHCFKKHTWMYLWAEKRTTWAGFPCHKKFGDRK